MVDYFTPNELQDTAAESLRKDLGQQAELEGRVVELKEALAKLPEGAAPSERAGLQLEMARALQVLERGDEAWPLAMTAFGIFSEMQDWERAADACDVAYQSDHADSLIALGHGIWISVTFPIDPEISVYLLSHVVDDGFIQTQSCPGLRGDMCGIGAGLAKAAFLGAVGQGIGNQNDCAFHGIRFGTRQVMMCINRGA